MRDLYWGIVRHFPSAPCDPKAGARQKEYSERGVDSQEHIQNRSAGARIYLQCH